MILTSSMGAEDLSVTLDLGSGMIPGSPGTQFSSRICNSDVVHGRRRFQRQRWKLVPVMVSRSTGSQFALMIQDSDVVHGRLRFQRHSGSGFWG